MNMSQPGTKIRLTAREKKFILHARQAPLRREEADKVCGASNSPGIVFNLRAKGFVIRTELRNVKDREGQNCRPGTFHLVSEPAGVEL